MRLSIAVGLVAVLPLAGCFVPIVIPTSSAAPAGPSVAVEVEGVRMTVRRANETFPSFAPVNALTAEGIAVAPDAPLPVRGQGEPAVVVGGTDLGQWRLSEAAVFSACGFTAEQSAAMGFDIARRSYDADAAEALYPLANCPGLDR